MENLRIGLQLFMGLMNKTGIFSDGSEVQNSGQGFDQVFQKSLDEASKRQDIAIEAPQRQEGPAPRRQETDYEYQAEQAGNQQKRQPEVKNSAETNTADKESENNNNIESVGGAAVNQDGDMEAADGSKTTMQELVKKLGLTDEQVANLADKLGVTVADLMKVTIEINPDAQKPISMTMPDGKKLDMAAFLNLKENGELLTGQDAVNRIAEVLGLEPDQAEQLVKELKINSVEIAKAYSGEEKAQKSGEGIQFLDAKAGEKEVTKKGNDEAMNKDGIAEEMAEGANAADGMEQNLAGGNNQNKGQGQNLAAMAQNGAAKNGSQSTSAAKTDGMQVNIMDGKSGAAQSAAQIKETAIPRGQTLAERVMAQITEKASVMNIAGRTEAKITLTPANLGQVDIKVVMHEAQMKGIIAVENQAVKQIIDENLNQLKATLEAQGISLDEVSVSVNQNKDGNRERFAENSGGAARLAENFSAEEAEADHAARQAETERIRRAARNSMLEVTA